MRVAAGPTTTTATTSVPSAAATIPRRTAQGPARRRLRPPAFRPLPRTGRARRPSPRPPPVGPRTVSYGGPQGGTPWEEPPARRQRSPLKLLVLVLVSLFLLCIVLPFVLGLMLNLSEAFAGRRPEPGAVAQAEPAGGTHALWEPFSIHGTQQVTVEDPWEVDLTYVPLARREGFRCPGRGSLGGGGERRDDLTFFSRRAAAGGRHRPSGGGRRLPGPAAQGRGGISGHPLRRPVGGPPVRPDDLLCPRGCLRRGRAGFVRGGSRTAAPPLPSIRFPWSCPGARSEPCKKEQIRLNNITLIGMPGSGKSTVGVLLAKSLGFQFVDVDLLIQQREGALLQELLDTGAWSPFWTRRRRPSAPWPARAPSSPPEAAPSAGRGPSAT